ncbi:hypothetical protein [Acidovorax soli]|uniref:hypothetical protein n=1 Tax=Acidovorax TaxID=12916 RepID=UPI0032B27BDB
MLTINLFNRLVYGALLIVMRSGLALIYGLRRVVDYKDSDDGSKMLALRGTHAFSKRTAAYATVGALRNDGSARFSPSVGVSNTALAPVAGQNQTGLMVGLRHAF